MDDQERTTPDEQAEPAHDRRRGPRRHAKGTVQTEDRRQNDRRNTPGIPALLDDILKSPEEEPTAD